MVYGDDGVLRYANHNLFLQSENFASANWIDGSISNGTRTNGSVSVSADNGYAYVRQNFTAINRYCVASYEITCDTTVSNVPIVFSNGTTNYPVVTSFIAGVPQRITSPSFAPAAFASVGIDLRDVVAPGGSNTTGYTVTFNKAQLQLQPNHDNTYIPTTSAAVYSLPIDHDPITHEALGVLIEEQRTNLLLNSEDLNSWTNTTNNTLTLNAIAAPNGSTTADLITRTAVAAAYRGTIGVVKAASAIQYTYTVFAKKSVNDYLSITVQASSGQRVSVAFNINTGTVGATAVSGAYTLDATSITDIGSGWFRCRVTCTTDTSTSVTPYVIPRADNTAHVDASDSSSTAACYLWGAQLEAGAFPTSYIPTVASQVTRAADQVSIAATDYAYSNVAGSWVVNYDLVGFVVNHRVVSNGSFYRWFYGRTTANSISTYNGTTTLDISMTSPIGRSAKIALAWDASGQAMAADGGPVANNTSPFGATIGTTHVGNDTGANQLNGHIKRLTYFPTRKSNAELQALTT